MEDDTPDEAGGHLHPLMQTLLEKQADPRKYIATYRLFRGPVGSEAPDSLLDFLELRSDDLSPIAREALEALDASATADDDWASFKWKLTAFIHLQDVFDNVLHGSVNEDAMILFQQYYFYYESLRILRESILCGLNGFADAAGALLRPFLEFSLLQNYFYRTIDEASSFAPLRQYFKTRVAPSTATVVKKAMPKDEFTRPIRFRLHSHLSGLSESILHPYHPDHSSAHHKGMVQGHSFESLHFWYTTRFILEAALWVYYVNFPMVFHPVDVVRKFGCNGPVGIYIDEYGGLCVRKSLSDADYDAFRAYSAGQQSTKGRLEYFASRSDLTDSEIQASWHLDREEEYPGLWPAYCQSMARLRALKCLAALRNLTPGSQDMPDALLRDVRSLAGWRTLSARARP